MKQKKSFSEQLAETGHPDYKDYLRSPHWLAFRAIVLKRDRRKCQACGKRGTQVHHKRYRLGREKPEDAVTLCGDCHEKIHAAHKAHHVPLSDFAQAVHLAGLSLPVSSPTPSKPHRLKQHARRKKKHKPPKTLSPYDQMIRAKEKAARLAKKKADKAWNKREKQREQNRKESLRVRARGSHPEVEAYVPPPAVGPPLARLVAKRHQA